VNTRRSDYPRRPKEPDLLKSALTGGGCGRLGHARIAVSSRRLRSRQNGVVTCKRCYGATWHANRPTVQRFISTHYGTVQRRVDAIEEINKSPVKSQNLQLVQLYDGN
jgi:hypothetical protein